MERTFIPINTSKFKPSMMIHTSQQYADFINSMGVPIDVAEAMHKQLALNDKGLIFLLNAKMK